MAGASIIGGRRACACFLIFIACLVVSTAQVFSQGTAFTFQGRLTENGGPANGSYDFQFTLKDASTAGNTVGMPVVVIPLGVTNGLFTVALDFGAAAFNGSPRWLEVGARTNGAVSAYVTLAPRTALTAAPYSIFTPLPAGYDTLNAQVAALITQLAALNAQLASLGSQTTNLSAQVTNLNLQVTNLNTQAVSLDLQVISLNTQVTNLNVQATNLNSQVTNLNSQVTNLNSQVAGLTNGSPLSIPPGVPVVSANSADAGYLAAGLQLFFTVASPAWVSSAASGVPTARLSHSSVWTGQQMIVWGGDVGSGTYSAGGAGYNPVTDQWQAVATFQAPSARALHTAVWTGTEMIIWGGFGTAGFASGGGRYHLVNQTWSSVSATAAPTARDGHVAVWTGSRMVVFSGRNAMGLLADGGVYNPATDAWSILPAVGALEGRRYAAAVYAGTNLVVWGGQGELAELGTGARLQCDAGGLPQQWLPMSTTGAPAARVGHTAVWTGSKVIIWGGQTDNAYRSDGALYDPAADTWTTLPATGAPSARANHVAVWSGSEMLVFSGEDATGSLPTGAAYDPLRNKWRTLDTSTGAVARTRGTGIWSGTELVLFGGAASGSPLAVPQRLSPQPAWYFYRKP